MRIKGAIEIEGIRLVVDIEAPDNEREVFVTNISPSFLVIPRARWPVEFLELDSEVIEAARTAGIQRLSDLVDEQWQLRLPDDLIQHHAVIQEAVKRLRGIALTFEPVAPEPVLREGREPFPIPTAEEIKPERKSVTRSPDSPLNSIGVPEKLLKTLEKQRGVTTIRDLLELGRRKLVMTTGITVNDVEMLEGKLADAGYDWDAELEHPAATQ